MSPYSLTELGGILAEIRAALELDTRTPFDELPSRLKKRLQSPAPAGDARESQTMSPEKLKQRDHQLMLKRETNSCRFYRGSQHETCGAGVNLRALVGGPDLGWGTRLPCLGWLFEPKGGEQATCDKRSCWTVEEAEANEVDHQRRIDNALRAMKAARDHANKWGLKKNHGGNGELPCPICQTGTLRYSVASYNGHLWGKCSTEDCVSWMQ